MDALRTAVSVWGAVARPVVAADARAGTRAHGVLAVRARGLRAAPPGAGAGAPDPDLDLVAGFLYQLNGVKPEAETARALDAYFIVGAEHGFNASTFTARVITSTRADIASAVCGAIGALKGPLHGGAPSEVVEQIHQVGSPGAGRGVGPRGAREQGPADGLRPPRVPRLRPAGRGAARGRGVMEHKPEWLELAMAVEDVALRVLAEKHPDRPLKTNVEFYAAPVLMGVGLTPDLFPATFALARHAGWTAHAIEQGANNRLIRPDVKYVGPGRATARRGVAPWRQAVAVVRQPAPPSGVPSRSPARGSPIRPRRVPDRAAVGGAFAGRDRSAARPAARRSPPATTSGPWVQKRARRPSLVGGGDHLTSQRYSTRVRDSRWSPLATGGDRQRPVASGWRPRHPRGRRAATDA